MSIRQCKKSMRRIVSGNKSDALRHGKAHALGRYLALAPAGALLSSMALASPQGGQVVGGTGSIAQPSATKTIVNQQTQKMAIDWQSFNLAAGESVRFNQPSSSATVLNRILDQNPSKIFGSIQANGRVFLANPNGIIFGESATINVGSFLATTLNTSVTDFMLDGAWTLGGDNLSAGGTIVNRGLIAAATGGSVTLVGGSVLNEGTIIATLGSVNLASGKVATLDFDGDGLLSFAVSGEVLENTSNAASAVANTGTITADGGQVLLTGHAAKDVFDKVVNNEGLVQANSIDTSGGTIRLVGGDSGIVANSGTLRAKGDDSGEKGGTVQILGEKVGLLDAGKVDVSGNAGGGTALIGGDYQGKNASIRNASVTYVGPNATIDASAMGIGDGGKVIVWGTDSMAMYGTILARGGLLGGDGGFVETSSHGGFNVTKAPDVGATLGNGGLWLIDPLDLVIDNTDSNVTENPPFTFSPSATSAHISWAIIDAALGFGDVTVTTVNTTGGEDGNITIAEAGVLTAAYTLTLEAENDLYVNASITGAGGNLALLAANDIYVDAAISGINNLTFSDFNGVFTLTNNAILTATTASASGMGAASLIVTRNADITLTDTLLNVGGSTSLTLSGITDTTITGGGGDNAINVSGWTGSSIINSTAGNDTVTGNGTNTTLVGLNTGLTFNITGANDGTAGSTSFMDVGNLIGGSGDDSFILAGGTLTGTINGGAGLDTFTGDNVANTFTITAANQGAATGITGGFSSIESLFGGSDTDAFTLAGGTLTGSIAGGTGSDSLTGDDLTNTFTISGADTGAVTGITGGFSSIENLIGGVGNDTFVVQDAGSLTGNISGGSAGTDTLDLSNKSGAVAINLQAATATGITGTFSNIDSLIGNGSNSTLTGTTAAMAFSLTGENDGLAGTTSFADFANLVGGAGNDTFVLNGGTLTGSIAGGTGSDSLTGDDLTNTFTITGANIGSVTGITGGFSSIENLIGGTGNDTFIVQDAGSVTGNLSGGSAGTDTLNLSNKSGVVAINLQAATATGITGTFSNIDTLIGNGSNSTLTGTTAAMVFSLTGENDGLAGTTSFADFANLVGGAGNDSFVLNGGTLTGSIAGGAGSDSLTGDDLTNTFTISGANIGSVTGITGGFSSIENLIGGTGNDTFVIQDAGSVTGNLSGGSAGTDTLNLSNKSGAVAINLQAATATGITGTFSNIDSLIGNGSDTTLTGTNNGQTFTLTAENDGAVGTTSFTDVANLVGGSGDDSFVLNGGTLTGSIAGGAGSDSLTGDDLTNTFTISGADAGAVTGVAGGFSSIENLIGGESNDTFLFTNAGTLSGNLAGGSQTSLDTLDLHAKSGTVTINQQTQKATGIAGIFTQIEKVIGDGSGTTLTGSNSGQTFTLTSTNAGKAGSLFFSGVANLIGGSGNDTYTGSGGSLSGTITDGAFTGDKTAFIEGGDGGSTTINGTLNVAGLYLNSTTLSINGDINTGSGTVYLRTVSGDIDNLSTGHTLTTSGNLYLVTSSHTGAVKMNLAGNPILYLDTWQPSTLNGQYNLIANINGVSIINALFDALVGSEFGAHDSIDYFIDPALFDQSISLFSSSEQSILLPEDQLEETLGKFYRWPAIRLAVLN